ncbi:MAG TPA: MoaD/ThiS family protein [Thermoanaerobaculia bacterium]|nr:MoaD/ThiS family protein [Thermoanaerobaculia bacterium]
MIRVRLLLFAVLRDIAGSGETDLVLRIGSTAGDVWQLLRERYPELEGYGAPPMTAVNMEYVPPDTPLREGDELAFIPPVSGG